MVDIYLLLLAFIVVWYFLYLRKVEESANKNLQQYCHHQDLQFIALARRSMRLRFNTKLGAYWLTEYELEFSGDGQTSYLGRAEMHGLNLHHVNLPPYRVQ